jgi:hypothetical protein
MYNTYNIYKIYNICNMPTYIYIPGADAYPRPRTCWDDRMSDGTSDGTMESLTTVKKLGFHGIL